MTTRNGLVPIPDLPANIPPELAQWAGSVSQNMRVLAGQLRGMEQYRSLTPSDLAARQIIGVKQDGTLTDAGPFQMPTPKNLKVVGTFGGVILTYEGIPTQGYAYTEILKAGTNNLSQAVHAGTTVTGGAFVPGSEAAYYWVRFVSIGNPGSISQVNSPGGTLGEPAQDPDYILNQLQGRITDSHLYHSLLGIQEELQLVGETVTWNLLAQYETATGLKASITEEARIRELVGGLLSAEWTLKIDVNGYVAGIGLSVEEYAPGAAKSEFVILADKFAVVTPSAEAGETPKIPFVIGQIGGGNFVTLGVTTAYYAKNMETAQKAQVTAVDSEERLTLASDIFTDPGGDSSKHYTYHIYDGDPDTTGVLVSSGISSGQATNKLIDVAEVGIGVDGRMYINGLLTGRQIAAGTITVDKLFAVDLAAITANLGTVTAGKLQSPDLRFTVDLTNKTITVKNGSDAVMYNVDNVGNVIANNIYARGDVEATTLNATAANIVATLHLQGQAVTIPVSAYTAGSITIPQRTWVTLQTATINSTGAPITISFFCRYVGIGGDSVDPSDPWHYRILRNGASILDLPSLSSINNPVVWGFSISDTPGVGSFTYTLQFYNSYYVATQYIDKRFLGLLETKK